MPNAAERLIQRFPEIAEFLGDREVHRAGAGYEARSDAVGAARTVLKEQEMLFRMKSHGKDRPAMDEMSIQRQIRYDPT